VPRDWPAAVRPPGSEDWEATAAAWLLDLMPEFRGYPGLGRQPVVLAFIVRHVLNGAVDGARQGYRTTRSELGALGPPHVTAPALADFRAEGKGPARTVVPAGPSGSGVRTGRSPAPAQGCKGRGRARSGWLPAPPGAAGGMSSSSTRCASSSSAAPQPPLST
jgi:hypothetical protein